MAKYLITGGLNGMWHKKKAEDIVPGGGSGIVYDVPMTVTMDGGSMAVSTEASFDEALSAANAGKIVRGVMSIGNTKSYAFLESVYFNGESYQLIFSVVSDLSGVSYARIIWDANDITVNVTPLST